MGASPTPFSLVGFKATAWRPAPRLPVALPYRPLIAGATELMPHTAAALPYRRLSRWLPFYHLEDRLYGVLVCTISLPLITLAGFLIFSPTNWGLDALASTVLLGTLIGLGAAMWMVNHLMAPVRLAQAALRGHRQPAGIPQIPTDLDGDAGEMLAELDRLIQTCERQRRQLESLQMPTASELGPRRNRATSEAIEA